MRKSTLKALDVEALTFIYPAAPLTLAARPVRVAWLEVVLPSVPGQETDLNR